MQIIDIFLILCKSMCIDGVLVIEPRALVHAKHVLYH